MKNGTKDFEHYLDKEAAFLKEVVKGNNYLNVSAKITWPFEKVMLHNYYILFQQNKAQIGGGDGFCKIIDKFWLPACYTKMFIVICLGIVKLNLNIN